MEEISELMFPPKPRSIEEAGLTSNFLADLALKTMHVQGLGEASQVADALKLPFVNFADKLLDALRRDRLLETVGALGEDPTSYRYAVTREGRLRARELLDQSQYIGPAPVSLAAYTKMVAAQSIAGKGISPEEIERALSHLVLPKEFFDQLGPAVNVGKSIFLFGNTGNGKTSIGLAIGAMMNGAIWVPYAVSVEGQIIKVFDSVVHQVIEELMERDETGTARRGLLRRLVVEKVNGAGWVRTSELADKRWVPIQRPLIVGGGELTLKNLDVVLDPTMKYYEAPHQMKANGGVFLIDDLGRQKASSREILNRWIIPLEKRVDYLTPALGNRIEIPFDTLLIFATNLDPAKIADETFLRRLRYKIHVTNPTWDAYDEIFRREAAARAIPFSRDSLDYLVEEYYMKQNRAPRGVHPRDLLDELVDIALYRGVPPRMSKELLALACQAYFVKGVTSGEID